MKALLIAFFVGTTSLFAQSTPQDVPDFLPPGTEGLSSLGLCMFAIWWLGKQNTQLVKDATDRERELKAEHKAEMIKQEEKYEERIDQLEKRVEHLQSIFLTEPSIDLSNTTRRTLLADSKPHG